jgi:enolase-phosphatase E1
VIRALLTDIEGTTSSIRFVYDVLFPYARARLSGFVREHGAEPEVRRVLDAVRAEAGPGLSDAQAVQILLRWMDEDRKATPLKTLQGMIWEAGFTGGDFTGHVYPDASTWLRQWHARGLRLCVYSSGSAHAQRLLFGHSDAGDLTPLFSGYFDTTTGPKREVESYRRIAQAIGVGPQEVLFLSDTEQELDAARAAGMHTCRLLRDALPGAPAAHPLARSFDDVEAWLGAARAAG